MKQKPMESTSNPDDNKIIPVAPRHGELDYVINLDLDHIWKKGTPMIVEAHVLKFPKPMEAGHSQDKESEPAEHLVNEPTPSHTVDVETNCDENIEFNHGQSDQAQTMAGSSEEWAEVEEVRRIVERPSYLLPVDDPNRSATLDICNDLDRGLKFKKDLFTYIDSPDSPSFQRTKNSLQLMIELFVNGNYNATKWILLNHSKIVTLAEEYNLDSADILLALIKVEMKKLRTVCDGYEKEEIEGEFRDAVINFPEVPIDAIPASMSTAHAKGLLMTLILGESPLAEFTTQLSIMWNKIYYENSQPNNTLRSHHLKKLELYIVYGSLSGELSADQVIKSCRLMGMFEVLKTIKNLTPLMEHQLEQLQVYNANPQILVKCKKFYPISSRRVEKEVGTSIYPQYSPSEDVMKQLVAKTNERSCLKIIMSKLENRLSKMKSSDRIDAYFCLTVLETLLLEGNIQVRPYCWRLKLNDFVMRCQSREYGTFEDEVDQLVFRVAFLLRNEFHYYFQREVRRTIKRQAEIDFEKLVKLDTLLDKSNYDKEVNLIESLLTTPKLYRARVGDELDFEIEEELGLVEDQVNGPESIPTETIPLASSQSILDGIKRFVKAPQAQKPDDPRIEQISKLCEDVDLGPQVMKIVWDSIRNPDHKYATHNSLRLCENLVYQNRANFLKFCLLNQNDLQPLVANKSNKLNFELAATVNRKIFNMHMAYKSGFALFPTLNSRFPNVFDKVIQTIKRADDSMKLQHRLSCVWEKLYATGNPKLIANCLSILECYIIYGNQKVIEACRLISFFDLIKLFRGKTKEIDEQIEAILLLKRNPLHKQRCQVTFQDGVDRDELITLSTGKKVSESPLNFSILHAQDLLSLLAETGEEVSRKRILSNVHSELKDPRNKGESTLFRNLLILEHLLVNGDSMVVDACKSMNFGDIVKECKSSNYDGMKNEIDDVVMRVDLLLRNNVHLEHQRKKAKGEDDNENDNLPDEEPTLFQRRTPYEYPWKRPAVVRDKRFRSGYTMMRIYGKSEENNREKRIAKLKRDLEIDMNFEKNPKQRRRQ